MEDSEVLRNEFRRPRDILLSLVADFHSKCTARLAEIHKKTGYDGKNVEILDIKSHLVSLSHRKFSKYGHNLQELFGYFKNLNLTSAI